jgi:hypothetical protein
MFEYIWVHGTANKGSGGIAYGMGHRGPPTGLYLSQSDGRGTFHLNPTQRQRPTQRVTRPLESLLSISQNQRIGQRSFILLRTQIGYDHIQTGC